MDLNANGRDQPEGVQCGGTAEEAQFADLQGQLAVWKKIACAARAEARSAVAAKWMRAAEAEAERARLAEAKLVGERFRGTAQSQACEIAELETQLAQARSTIAALSVEISGREKALCGI